MSEYLVVFLTLPMVVAAFRVVDHDVISEFQLRLASHSLDQVPCFTSARQSQKSALTRLRLDIARICDPWLEIGRQPRGKEGSINSVPSLDTYSSI